MTGVLHLSSILHHISVYVNHPFPENVHFLRPVPVFFDGFEIGVSFQTGFAALDQNNPVSVAYELHNHGHNASYDPAAVDFAFRGVCEDWTLSEPLSVHVNDDATISFQPDANGIQTYLKFADEGARERVRLLLDEIYSAPVK